MIEITNYLGSKAAAKALMVIQDQKHDVRYTERSVLFDEMLESILQYLKIKYQGVAPEGGGCSTQITKHHIEAAVEIAAYSLAWADTEIKRMENEEVKGE